MLVVQKQSNLWNSNYNSVQAQANWKSPEYKKTSDINRNKTKEIDVAILLQTASSMEVPNLLWSEMSKGPELHREVVSPSHR